MNSPVVASGEAPPCPVCGESRFEPLFFCSDRLHGLPGEFQALRCRECGVVTYEPRLSDEELAAYYPPDYYAREPAPAPPNSGKTRAKRLLDEVHLGARPGWGWKIALAPALFAKRHLSHARHLARQPPGRLLDIGCGDGAFLEKARLLGFSGEGVEPGAPASPNWATRGMIATQNANLDETPPGGEGLIAIRAVPLERLAGGREAFDLIALNHSLEHFQDPAAALEKVRELLAPGGRVLVRMPDTDSTAFRRWPLHWPGLQIPRHVFLFNRNNFRRLAERLGFEVIAESKEMSPLHWQWALKSKLLGRPFEAPCRWLDSSALTLALAPAAEIANALGLSDMMIVWLRRRSDDKPS